MRLASLRMFSLPVRNLVDAILPPGDRRIAVVLFCAALLLYVPGIWWGLPYATAPDRIKTWDADELGPLGPVAELYSVFVSRQTFNPQYPLFEYFVQALFVGPYLLFLRLTGELASVSTTYPFGLANPVDSLATMTILARLPNAIMAAGVVVVAFRTATILWNRAAGAFAGVLAMSLYPMFYYSRVSNVDMGMLFWTSLGLAIFAACLRDSLTPRRAALLGVFAALAAASKDAAYATFASLLLALLPWHFLHQWRQPADRRRMWRAPLVGLISAVAVYSCASGLIFNLKRFLLHVEFITQGSPSGSIYFNTPATLAGYFSLAQTTAGFVVEAMGLPMTLAAILGMAICSLKSPRTLLLALPILGTYLLVLVPVRFVQFRFVIIIVYVLALFAAVALAAAVNVHRPELRRAGQIASLIVCGWALVHGGDLTWQMLHDSRYASSEWLRRHAAAGDRVGYYGAPVKLPHMDRGIRTLSMPGQYVSSTRAATEIQPPKFVIVIPVQSFEVEHEFTLPAETYEALNSGSKGYKEVLELRTPSLFSNRPISSVNPRVRIFERQDDKAVQQFPHIVDPHHADKQVTMDGIRIRYRMYGKTGGPLVFIHGWGGSQTFWRNQVSPLSKTNRLLTLDLPGHGASDKPAVAYTLDLLARSVDAVLQDAGVKSAILVGHSMGAAVAHQFYRRFPQKTIAIVSVDGSFLRPRDTPEEAMRGRAALDSRIQRLRQANYWKAAVKEVSFMFAPSTPDHLRTEIRLRVLQTPQHVAVSTLEAFTDPSVMQRDTISHPVLVILPDIQKVGASREPLFRSVAPRAEFQYIGDVGHFIMLENPAELNARISAFLSRHRLNEDNNSNQPLTRRPSSSQ